MSRLSALFVVVLALVAPASASAREVVSLPWPPSVLPVEPPLAPRTASTLPLPPIFVRHIENRERVTVGMSPDGTPQSVTVLQTITVKRLGNYIFAIAAPVRLVRPGPETESQPGQRTNQILWQGFSAGHRVLSASADLRAAESVPKLPLRVHVETEVAGRPLLDGERRSGPLTVKLSATNATSAVAKSFTAEPDPHDLALVLARIRGAIKAGVNAEGLNLAVLGPRQTVSARVAAPLRVRGTIRFTPGTVEIDGPATNVIPVSGTFDGQRGDLTIEAHGHATNAMVPKVRLTVRTRDVPDMVVDSQIPRQRLHDTIALELAYARKRQYDQFLASPDPTGQSSTAYVYRTAAAPSALPPATGGTDDHMLGWIVLIVGLAVGLPAAAVAWAHS